tara:strand:- start:433 stop:963 length:531 start_codon:yes stop_codon:yes gene_type:complete
MNFEEYLNETLNEGPLSRTLGALAIAGSVFGGPIEDAYDDARDVNKPLIAATSALVNTVKGGQKATAALFKLIKRLKDEDSKEELIDYGAEISTISPVRKGGIRSQFVIPIGQDKKEVEDKASEVLKMVEDHGKEDMNKLGDIVVEKIDVDGNDWFIAYPENADLAYLLNQRIRGM